MKKFLFFDVECFPNYFMIGVLKDDRYEVFTSATLFEKFINTHKQDYIFVGYNCVSYDNVMIQYWLNYKNASFPELKALSDTLIEKDGIIEGDSLFYVKLEAFCYLFKDRDSAKNNYKIYLSDMLYDSFDLIMWGKSEFNSLKNCQLLLNIPYRKLPFAPGYSLTEQQKAIVTEYCGNDLQATKAVFEFYQKSGDVDVRLRYMNLFPRAGQWKQARLAEDFFIYLYNHLFEHKEDYKELKKRDNPAKNVKQFPVESVIKHKYEYNDKVMQNCYLEFLKYSVKMSPKFKPSISGNLNYVDKDGMFIFKDSANNIFKIGTGGLHNEAPCGLWRETDKKQIVNVDATSFWPFIVSTLKLGTPLYPKYHEVMSIMLNERIRYKAKGSKLASVLKLAINSVNGKTGERFSSLYSQKLSCGLKMNGELMLLKLWDMLLSSNGHCEMINANTDGLFFYCDINFDYVSIFEMWTKMYNIPFEYENYKIVGQSSVNDYFAVSETGKLKTKGGFFQIEIDKMDIKFAKSMVSKKMAIHYLQYGKFPNLNEYNTNEFVVTVSGTKESGYVIYPFKQSGTVALIASKNGCEVYKHRFNKDKNKDEQQNLFSPYIFEEYVHGNSYDIDTRFYESEAWKIINSVLGGKK